MAKTKICSKCEKKFPLTTDYFSRSKNGKDGFDSWCKKCKYAYHKKYRKSSHGYKVRQEGKLKKKYNLSLEQYDQMFEEQDGVCAICNSSQAIRRLAVDHNHKTGKIRGLLCIKCNLLLGQVENNLELVREIMDYIKKYDSKKNRNLTLKEKVMKKFVLDLSEYEVEVLMRDMDSEKHEMKKEKQPYPLRENINAWLRGVGIFRTAEDIAEAINIAKQIRDCKEDSIILDERETGILKQAVNRLVELTADGKANLGGELHEEAILRVVKMKEVE